MNFTGHLKTVTRHRAMVLKRNGMVNEKYNTQIITECLTAETLYDTVMKAEKSGDFFSDFLVLRSGDMSPYLLAGYLLNLKSLPFTDYSAPYFNQEAMSQLTLGGAVYGAVGDATEQLEHYVCLYFNKTYAKELGVSCPYEDVYEGTFTWERFLTSLSGLPEGAVGFVSAFSDSNTAAMSFFSGGGNFLVANQKGKLRLACENDVATALVGHVKSLLKLDTPSLTWTPAGKDETEKLEGFDIFEKGQALYAMGTLDKMELLENAGFSWEVLPLPKVSTDAPYSTPLTGNAPIIVALASSQNVDTMGYILQAVNAASCGYVINEFYTDAMRRLITGVNTLDMLDISRENPLYDIGFMLGEDAKAVREGTYGSFYEAVKGKHAFSSYLDKKESALNKYLDKLL